MTDDPASRLAAAASYGADIFAEPDTDPNTLAKLGPLTRLAGTWEGVPGTVGTDRHPEAEGPVEEPFVEHIVLDPIDAQTNGPQLYYGLRYHTHITRPDETKTFHDQVGYWLWEPATETVVLSLAIPRAQVALAVGPAAAHASSFTVAATRGWPDYGIASNPFLERAFTTTRFEMTVTFNDDGTWSYDQTTTLDVEGGEQGFAHRDFNTLHRVAEPRPNPRARR